MKRLIALAILVCLVLVKSGCMAPATSPSPQALSPPPVPDPSPSSPPAPSTPPPPTLSATPIREVSQSGEQILSRYAWDYGGRDWSLELTIPGALYNYYKEIPRPPTQNYTVYVTHPLDDTYMNYLAKELEEVVQNEGFDELATVEFAAAFIQSLPYTADSVTTPYDEYPRFPIETLVDRGGDCEDTSILVASLLDSLGYRVVLVVFPDKHCAVGVSVGKSVEGAYFEHGGEEYFFLETTDVGWGVGQIPDELKRATSLIYDMTPTPILTHDWNATISGNIAKLEITVENLGSQSADEVYILAGFDAGGGQLWNSQESKIFAISVDQCITSKFTLQVPREKHTRLLVQIIYDGYVVDESYSDWLDT